MVTNKNKTLAEAYSELPNLSKQARILACQDFRLFYAYYFGHYIKSPFADFHFDMFQDLKDLESNIIDEVMWCMFRESAKTSLIKGYIGYCIAYKKETFIAVVSYSTANADKLLLDTAIELQTNKNILNDFGELYNESRSPNAKTEKRINSSITRNGIQLKSFTTAISLRGQLAGPDRPSLLIYDDFETIKTVQSTTITQSIIDNMNEARTGIQAGRGKTIYLANYLSQRGVVQYYMDLLTAYSKGRLRVVPILNENNIPTWSGKYTYTAEPGKVSIQGLQEKYGDRVFQLEYMLQPSAFVPERSYYYEVIDELRNNNRIIDIPYDPHLPTFTWWDLGLSDNMVVLFFQKNNLEWRLIDYIDVSQKSLQEVILSVLERPYTYIGHYAPHDIQVRELSTGKTRLEIASEFGINFDITPNIPRMDGINAVRTRLNTLWVDNKCAKLLTTLSRYREQNGKPLHDWTSHIADAFRYWAVTDVGAPQVMTTTVPTESYNNPFSFRHERARSNNYFGLD